MPGWQPNCGNTGEIGRVTSSGSDNRRRIGRPGGLLATAVVLALAVAAVGVRAAAGATLRNAGLAVLGAVGLALLFAIAAVITAAKYREHVRTTESANTAEDRLRQATIAVLFASAALVPFALLLLHRPITSNAIPFGVPTGPPPGLSSSSPKPHPTLPPAKGHDSFALRTFLLVVLIAIGVFVLLWMIVTAIRLLRKLSRITPATSAPPIDGPTLEDEALADALLAGRAALASDDTRAAIIACYAAMEASLEQVGVMRERADSPSDLLRRVTNRDFPGTGTQAAATLTALFREARFSSHPMTARQLEAARGALDAITATLAERIRAQGVAS
jgi:hypothetical protein